MPESGHCLSRSSTRCCFTGTSHSPTAARNAIKLILPELERHQLHKLDSIRHHTHSGDLALQSLFCSISACILCFPALYAAQRDFPVNLAVATPFACLSLRMQTRFPFKRASCALQVHLSPNAVGAINVMWATGQAKVGHMLESASV